MLLTKRRHRDTDLDPLDPADIEDRLFGVEQYGIEHIPDEERRSRPSNLFFIIHGSCITFSLFVIGWFPLAFGLSCGRVHCRGGGRVHRWLLLRRWALGPRSGTNNHHQRRSFRHHGSLIGTFPSVVLAAFAR